MSTMRLCREKVKRDNTQLELRQASAIKDNKNMFSNTLAAEEMVKENLCHLLDTGGNTSSPGKWWSHYPRRYLKDMVFRDMVYSGKLGSAGLMIELDDLKAFFQI